MNNDYNWNDLEISNIINIIIVYNPQFLSKNDKRLKVYNTNSKDCISQIAGVHECYIINKGTNKKGFRIFQIFIPELQTSILASPNKWELYLQGINKDKFVIPSDDNEYKKITIRFFITENINHDPIDYLEDIGLTDNRKDIRDFISSLSELQVPQREIHMEKDREMWQAYIDGQSAINADNKELYKIISVGDFKKENHNDRSYTTITLKLEASSLADNVVDELRSILESLYPDVNVKKQSDKIINVCFPKYESISEDTLSEIGDKVAEKCFKLDGSIKYELSANLHLCSKDDFQSILSTLDKALIEDFDANINRNEGLYLLEDDDEVEFLKAYIEKTGFRDSVFASECTSSTINFFLSRPTGDEEIDRNERKKLLRPVVLNMIDYSQTIKFNLSEGNAELHPKSKKHFFEIIDLIKSKLPENINISDAEYKPSLSVSLKTDNLDYCKNIFDTFNKSLHEEFTNVAFFCKDKEEYKDFCIKYKFNNEEQLASFKQYLESELNKYDNLIDLSYEGSDKGITSFSVCLDTAQLQRFSSSMQQEFKLQEIRLINGEKYDAALEDLNDSLIDVDEDLDWETRTKQKNEIKAKRHALVEVMEKDAFRLGQCLSRSMDTVRFRISKEFSERISATEGQPKSKDFIKVGDYIQFPLSGETAELSRQQESMYRIAQPNTTQEIQGYWKKINSPANPLLSQFLFDPRYAGDPSDNIEDIISDMDKPGKHIEDRMNRNQKYAVATAVAAPDFAIIQGPPGTGKTTVIAEIIWQEIRRNPKVKILLTSQTNLAVDNALGRLKGKPGIRPARILPPAKSDTERLNFDERRYLLKQIDSWGNSPSEINSDNGAKLWMDRIKSSLSSEKKYENALLKWKKELDSADKMLRNEFVSSYKENINLVAATCSICGSWQFRKIYTELFNDQDEAFDVVIMDEASKATPLEMAVPMVWGKKIIIIGDHKQLPPMMQEGNILDSLKRIGRKDLADRIEQFKESQFEILFEASSRLKKNLVAQLNEQYRMHEQIMNTINHFYKNDELSQDGLTCGIRHCMDLNDPNNGGSRYHGITLEPFINPNKHVIWVDVPDLEDKQNTGSTSRTNKAEAEAICLVIKALKQASGFNEYINSQKTEEDKEIGVITFYGAQASLIDDMKNSGKLDKSLKYRINVVDKFQGMERNVVIISTVRSNKNNDYGFTSDPRRINVGFSRAKSLLIIVGNRSFLAKNSDYAKAIASIGSNRIDIQTLKHLIK